MYELVIIWESGEKNIYHYDDRETAEEREKGFHTAFGNQISWSGIRRATQ